MAEKLTRDEFQKLQKTLEELRVKMLKSRQDFTVHSLITLFVMIQVFISIAFLLTILVNRD